MTPSDLPPAAVRAQLRRITASLGIRNASGLRRMLEFTVERALAGDTTEIKEFTLGVEVFGRPSSFDPQDDAIVRVQARRLRERLTAYYEQEGARDPIRIEYPLGRYIPQFSAVAATEEWPERSLAVLPFVNLGPPGEAGHLPDGITEELIFVLSRLEGIRVVSRTSAFAARERNLEIREIGRKLNAEFVVEGTVRQVGQKFRVTAQLIKTEDGLHLWSDRWECAAGDLFQIDEVAAAVAMSLHSRIAATDSAGRRARDPQVHDLYLKGRHCWNQRTEQGFENALRYYRAALERDPRFARAWAAIAEASVLIAAHHLEAPDVVMPKAREAAQRALELDPQLASAHCALAAVAISFDRNLAGARKEWDLALEIDPHYAWAWHGRAMFCNVLRNTEEGLAHLREALRLEPLSAPIANDFGFAYYYGRRYGDAIEHCRQALQLHPTFARIYVPMARSFAASGQYEEAVRCCLAGRPLFTGRAFLGQLLATLGYSYGRLGRSNEANGVLAELEEIARGHYVSEIDRAMIYAGAGNRALALDSLDEAFRQHAFWLTTLPIEPLLDDLRAESRFHAMCETLYSG